VATYGERILRGSDMDPTKPEEGSSLPADPTMEELQFLSKFPNLSPSCAGNSLQFCQEFDNATFVELSPEIDYVVMHGYRHTVNAFSKSVPSIEAVTGKPIIYIDVSLEGPDCSPGAEDRCYGKSMIDLLQQMEKLALALDITPPDSLDMDKEDLCQAAQKFQQVSKVLHGRGVRVMAASLGHNGLLSFLPTPDINYFANPPDDFVLRMLEELGLPLLHVECDNPNSETDECPFDGYYWETVSTGRYFGSCSEGQEYSTCNENVLYPVDFWLYDHRTTQFVTNPDFAIAFPDKAIQASQIAYWPIGNAISHRHATEILTLVGDALATAQRQHDPTDCQVADVSGVAHRVAGLKGGQYACYYEEYHRKEYLTCPSDVTSPPSPSPVDQQEPSSSDDGTTTVGDTTDSGIRAEESKDDGLSTGALVGIVVSGAAAAIVVLAGAWYACSRQKELDTLSESNQRIKRAEDADTDGQNSEDVL